LASFFSFFDYFLSGSSDGFGISSAPSGSFAGSSSAALAFGKAFGSPSGAGGGVMGVGSSFLGVSGAVTTSAFPFGGGGAGLGAGAGSAFFGAGAAFFSSFGGAGAGSAFFSSFAGALVGDSAILALCSAGAPGYGGNGNLIDLPFGTSGSSFFLINACG